MKLHLTIKIAALGVIAAGMALAQTAAAQLGVQARIERRLLQVLNLTDAQRQQAKTIRQATQTQAKPVAEQLRAARQTLAEAVQAGDEAKIPADAAAVGSLQGQVLAVRSAGMAKFLAILTPEQKAKAADFRQKVKQLLGAGAQ